MVKVHRAPRGPLATPRNSCNFCNKFYISNISLFDTSTEMSQRNGVSWKNANVECFGKFMLFATTWALRFSKLKKNKLRK